MERGEVSMGRTAYPSDLSEAQWAVLAPLIPPARPGGRPRKVNVREVINAIFYLVRAGCSWRMLPHDLPPWSTVEWYYNLWRKDGTWVKIHTALRQEVRVAAGREAEPSAAILDSQSVKTTEKGGPSAVTMRARK
jgi:putative transposase